MVVINHSDIFDSKYVFTVSIYRCKIYLKSMFIFNLFPVTRPEDY